MTGTRVEFVVPGTPHGKGRPRIGKIGKHARLFTPDETVAYEGKVALAAHRAMAGRNPIEGATEVLLAVYMAVPASWSGKKQRMALAGETRPITKPDVDNVVKSIFDGLNGVAWRDDVQVTDLRVLKRYSARPRVAVRIIEIVPAVEQLELASA